MGNLLYGKNKHCDVKFVPACVWNETLEQSWLTILPGFCSCRNTGSVGKLLICLWKKLTLALLTCHQNFIITALVKVLDSLQHLQTLSVTIA